LFFSFKVAYKLVKNLSESFTFISLCSLCLLRIANVAKKLYVRYQEAYLAHSHPPPQVECRSGIHASVLHHQRDAKLFCQLLMRQILKRLQTKGQYQ
jgi:hypothetical protein